MLFLARCVKVYLHLIKSEQETYKLFLKKMSNVQNSIN